MISQTPTPNYDMSQMSAVCAELPITDSNQSTPRIDELSSLLLRREVLSSYKDKDDITTVTQNETDKTDSKKGFSTSDVLVKREKPPCLSSNSEKRVSFAEDENSVDLDSSEEK